MTTPKPFPRRFYTHDYETYTASPELAQMVWLRVRPKGVSWYATDYEVVSPNEIRLFVYDMHSFTWGGVGKKIFEQNITEFTDEERAELKRVVHEIYEEAAEAEYERRQEELRRAEIARVRIELFGE